MLVARWLARFVVSSARLRSAHLNYFTSRADILARFVNEPARELDELPYFANKKLYVYHLRNTRTSNCITFESQRIGALHLSVRIR
jgi:hypothetical protein